MAVSRQDDQVSLRRFGLEVDPDIPPLREAVAQACRAGEADCVNDLITEIELDEHIVERIRARARVGNTCVNPNTVGSVVGVQPFGGEGLSGTGHKVGGPHTLPRFAVERAWTVNTTAVGGNATLYTLGED